MSDFDYIRKVQQIYWLKMSIFKSDIHIQDLQVTNNFSWIRVIRKQLEQFPNCSICNMPRVWTEEERVQSTYDMKVVYIYTVISNQSTYITHLEL